MLGSNFDSFESFKIACLELNQSLDPAYVLAKVYLIHQLREIVRTAGIRISEIEDHEREGVGRRYELSANIAEAIEPKRLGEIISRFDHNCYFHYLSYAKMTDSGEYSSKESFISNLNNRDFNVENNYEQFFNGIVNPVGRRCNLESVYIPENEDIISLVYSCTRVLTIPDGSSPFDFKNMFLSRVPLLVRFYFEHRLIEFSVPSYAETIAGEFDYDNRIPFRFQLMINSVINHLQDQLGLTLWSVNYDKFLLFIETIPGVEDMGWKILPNDAATFDLKQGAIPLKTILDTFSMGLKKEIERRGITHALAEINLYELFRSIKEQSYTQTMVLKVPYGTRGGKFLITVINGDPNSRYLPVVTVSKNNVNLSAMLAESIRNSQESEIPNPYNFDSIFSLECQ